MQSDSAPEVDGDRPTVALSHPEPAGDDPVRRLLGGAPDPVRQMGLRHWLGILGLVAAIATAAFVLPPLITSGAPPQSLAAPQWSSASNPSAATEPSTGAVTSPSLAAPKTAPTTLRSSGSSGAAAVPTPAPTAKSTTRATGTTTGPFSAITVQAEASNSTLTEGATVADCATCEAGARVRYLGRVDIHTTVSESGTRHLTFVYEVDGTRSFAVYINGGAAVSTSTVTGTDWTTPHSVTVSASIPAGSVDIGFYGYAGNAPDFDAVTIS